MSLIDSAAFDERVQHLMQEWHVPGVAIAIVHKGFITSRGFGQASLDPPKPCTADTIFDIASASKSMTAASIGLLVDDDERYPEVQWQAKMSSLLPEDFVMAEQSYTDDITVEDVLSHRTGLPSHDFSCLGIGAKHMDSALSITRNLKNLPISAAIRSKWMYSNLMFTVATYLVEKTTGTDFAAFLQQNFFSPLSMDSSHLQPEATIAAGLKDRMATPHTWDDESSTYKTIPVLQTPEAQGAGSIFTSANDYIKYVKAMLYQEAPITKILYEGVTEPRMIQTSAEEMGRLPAMTSPYLYAAGWTMRWYHGHQIIGHDGLVNGFASSHFFIPKYDFGAVIFANCDTGQDLCPIIEYELIDEISQVPQSRRPDWSKLQKEESEFDDSKTADELKRELCPDYDANAPQPQTNLLRAYVGDYRNAGYHSMTVEVKDDSLSIDATDRSFPFHLNFEHVCNQTEYIAHFVDFYDGNTTPFAAQFQIEDGVAVRMGIKLEEDLDDFIWFDRVDDSAVSGRHQDL